MSQRSSDLLRSRIEEITALSDIDVKNLMTLLENYPPKEWAEVIRLMVPTIIETYGTISSDITETYYSERREVLIERNKEDGKSKPKPTGKKPRVVKAISSKNQIVNSLNYFIGEAFANTPDEILQELPENLEANDGKPMDAIPEKLASVRKSLSENIVNLVNREVFNHSRDTTIRQSQKEGSKLVARRSVNTNGCNFCKLQYVGGKNVRKQAFHEGCHCTIDLVSPNDTEKPGWLDSFDEKYKEAAKQGYGTDASTIISVMRELEAS